MAKKLQVLRQLWVMEGGWLECWTRKLPGLCPGEWEIGCDCSIRGMCTESWVRGLLHSPLAFDPSIHMATSNCTEISDPTGQLSPIPMALFLQTTSVRIILGDLSNGDSWTPITYIKILWGTYQKKCQFLGPSSQCILSWRWVWEGILTLKKHPYVVCIHTQTWKPLTWTYCSCLDCPTK